MISLLWSDIFLNYVNIFFLLSDAVLWIQMIMELRPMEGKKKICIYQFKYTELL